MVNAIILCMYAVQEGVLAVVWFPLISIILIFYCSYSSRHFSRYRAAEGKDLRVIHLELARVEKDDCTICQCLLIPALFFCFLKLDSSGSTPAAVGQVEQQQEDGGRVDLRKTKTKGKPKALQPRHIREAFRRYEYTHQGPLTLLTVSVCEW